MKSNNSLLLICAASFSYLFYDQNAGINLLLFTILMVTATAMINPAMIRHRGWLFSAALAMIASTSVFVHSSALAIIANLFSVFMMCGYAAGPRMVSVSALFYAFYSAGTSLIYAIADLNKRDVERSRIQTVGYQALLFAAAALASIAFFALYRHSNPLFEQNTKWISLDFISAPWAVFTLFGFLLVYGLLKPRTIPFVEGWRSQLSDQGSPADPAHAGRHGHEQTAGLALFGILNVMLLLLNLGDINSFWKNGTLPEGITLSDFVHDGVESMIVSIIFAITLIMLLTRNDFQSVRGARPLRWLIFLWIAQSLLMLISTAWRNKLYIDAYQLTHLRIGVFVWLLLAATGLVLTFMKIAGRRSNWFLIHANVSAWVTMLCISTVVPWDPFITRYNISHTPIEQLDTKYLMSLSPANIPELVALTEKIDRFAEPEKAEQYHKELKKKIAHFSDNYSDDWQSFDLIEGRILAAIEVN